LNAAATMTARLSADINQFLTYLERLNDAVVINFRRVYRFRFRYSGERKSVMMIQDFALEKLLRLRARPHSI